MHETLCLLCGSYVAACCVFLYWIVKTAQPDVYDADGQPMTKAELWRED